MTELVLIYGCVGLLLDPDDSDLALWVGASTEHETGCEPFFGIAVAIQLVVVLIRKNDGIL